jgi:argininosuccinate synthase
LQNLSVAAIQMELAAEDDTKKTNARSGGGKRGKFNKVVLAYSGGLDTSVIVPWLRFASCFSF